MKTLYLLHYTSKTINNFNKQKLANTIYKNFIDLEQIPELGHTLPSIISLFESPETITLIAYDGQSHTIAGYLIAKHIFHEGGSYMHIYYIYVAVAYRNSGIGTQLLTFIKKCTKQLGIPRISLTYDTSNLALKKLYNKNKFLQSPLLTSGKRHDMLVCIL